MQFVVLADSKITYSLELRDFNLLQCLFQSKDFVATRKELLTAGWPNRTVSETSLNVAMMKLRKKLEQCSDILQIQTISAHGYRIKLGDGVRFIESKSEINLCLKALEKRLADNYDEGSHYEDTHDEDTHDEDTHDDVYVAHHETATIDNETASSISNEQVIPNNVKSSLAIVAEMIAFGLFLYVVISWIDNLRPLN